MNCRTYNKTENIYYKLIKGVIIGVILMLVAFWFWWSFAGNALHELALIRHGQTTQGFVVDTFEYVDESDAGQDIWTHVAVYEYSLQDGRKLKGRLSGSGRLKEEFQDLAEPYAIEIEYLPDNPYISRIKGSGCASITEWLWRKVAIGGILLVVFLSIGFVVIREAINEFRRSKCSQ